MAGRMTMKSTLKKVEKSAADRARDKRTGTKEGSARDMKLDRAQARKMMGRKK